MSKNNTEIALKKNHTWEKQNNKNRRRRKFFENNKNLGEKSESEKNKIIKTAEGGNFFENNKNLAKFLSGFLKIIKTYEKIQSS